MNSNLRTLPDQLKSTFERFSATQKITLISLSAATVAVIIILMIWANRPQYTILFSNLSSTDAAKIRDQLQDEKVNYQLRDGGSTILVPKDRMYDLRLQLASEGVPSQVGTGYEIFDRTNLGMSDFVQKLNYKRALETELARTVSSLSEVDQARVHVVMPEPALFREDEKQTTASVVLKLRGRSRLREEQIRGINILVARSVEGLDAENVTILDSHGNLLSGWGSPDPMLGLTSTQMELQQKVESQLASKTQSMLDGVLGPGRSIVRISSELDFQTIERTSETYDPESSVVRSEERTESSSKGTGAPQTKEENTLSNYEINKTVERLVNSGGSILRLSVAVMVDGIYSQAEDGSMEYAPRADEEMTSLENMVKGALGLREDRGDVLEITNIAFDRETFTDVSETWAMAQYQDLAITLLPKVILGVVLFMLLFMLRGFLKKQHTIAKNVLQRDQTFLPEGETRTAQLLPGRMGAGSGTESKPAKVELPSLDSEVSEEALTAKARTDQIMEFAKEKPEVATQLLRSWLVESD
ncbi:flagellar M-ring protein FliF [candidate division LCP-89 bacterium B3_LCP]|uniref:Flagellar M-ring protein n=1 Tax=candidate division LCP-89 bacterium B3_LCP TaxID=2012998 RepID=A0A532V4U9_UNCL8|nr:MAG: flagellar M-ring protein FliF [candidate division LCP-89 bacterium B3_LCP]